MVSDCLSTSQSAVLTPITDLAVFSILSWHMPHIPETGIVSDCCALLSMVNNIARQRIAYFMIFIIVWFRSVEYPCKKTDRTPIKWIYLMLAYTWYVATIHRYLQCLLNQIEWWVKNAKWRRLREGLTIAVVLSHDFSYRSSGAYTRIEKWNMDTARAVTSATFAARIWSISTIRSLIYIRTIIRSFRTDLYSTAARSTGQHRWHLRYSFLQAREEYNKCEYVGEI